MLDIITTIHDSERERREQQRQQALDRYNAAYHNDQYHRVTWYFCHYMSAADAIKACDLLIDTCIDRCTGINRGFADVELRQMIFKYLDGIIWCDCRNELNSYLTRFHL